MSRLFDITHQQLNVLAPEKRLVILHPANYQHQRQIAYAFLHKAHPCVYLPLTTKTTTLSSFLEALQDCLQQQAELDLSTMTDLAAAINTLPACVLLIENYDYAADEEIDRFILNLAAQLHPQHYIVVHSRHLPVLLLELASSQTCTMLPDLPQQLFVNYVDRFKDKHILEVRALGPSQAFINGRSLTQWDGALPKSLFYYLVDRAMATRNDIFETFWPNLDKREATNVFHVTKRKVSEILGQDLTAYGSGFYRLADNIELYYDVVAFQEAVQNAEIADDDAEAMALYEEAIRLYRGDFLNTLDLPWVNDRREELQMVYAEALAGLAHLYQKQGDEQQTLGLYLRAAAAAPQREDFARHVMELYRQYNAHSTALELYANLEQNLKLRFELEPSPETRELAEAIRAELG